MKIILKLAEGQFCPDNTFRKQVINLLHKYIFDDSKTVNDEQRTLEDVYDTMAERMNEKDAQLLYPMNVDMLKTGPEEINTTKLCSDSQDIYAGHDLPVWSGNPQASDYKLMVVSQDPRRSDKEMEEALCDKENKKGITLSTPFGFHNYRWRNHQFRGLPHYLAQELTEDFAKQGKTLSVYHTDFYKLRGAGEKSKVDEQNEVLYIQILKEELELVNPDIVLLMGNGAKEAWEKTESDIDKEIVVVATPHPNARPDAWKSYSPEIKGYSAKDKRECIKRDILSKLPS